MLERDGRHRHRHVVGEGGCRRLRRHRRRASARFPRLLGAGTVAVRARPRTAWFDGRVPRSTRSAPSTRPGRGCGDGAVAHGRRRRRQPVRAGSPLRRRARPRRSRATRSRAESSDASSAGSRTRFPTRAATGRRRRSPTSRSAASRCWARPRPRSPIPLFNWVGWDEAALAVVGRRARADADAAPSGTAAVRSPAARVACSRAGRSTRWASRSSRAPTTTATCS